jgi:hypothetical protein
MEIKWRKNAFYDLRRTREVRELLEGISSEVMRDANASKHDGGATYDVGSRQGRRRPFGRWRTSVVTSNFKAFLEEGRHNTLQKALEAQGTTSSTDGRT